MSHNSHGSHDSHASHGNHNNYSNDKVDTTHGNTGAPESLTWSHWGTMEDDEYISDSVNKIRELRDQVQYLHDNYGGGSWNNNPPDNPAINSGPADTEFDGDQTDYIEDVHYDTIRNNLDTLTQHIKGTGTGLPTQNDGDYVTNEDFVSLKQEIENLASYDATNLYSNHENHNSHGNHGNHGSHGSHNDYKNN